jgi:magnesium chelatase family protein
MKVIKVARTIADIGDEDRIRLAHVAEAVQYRGLDRRIGA